MKLQTKNKFALRLLKVIFKKKFDKFQKRVQCPKGRPYTCIGCPSLGWSPLLWDFYCKELRSGK
jgi:hypothetical protein